MRKNPTLWPTSLWKHPFPVLFMVFILIATGCASPSTSSGGVAIPTGNGTISGQVIGREGPVSGALVQLSYLAGDDCAAASDKGLDAQIGQSDADIELLKSCREQFNRLPTDENGSYQFTSIPWGNYAIWIHWEQTTPPDVTLREIPQAGYSYVTLYTEMIGSSRVDVSMHEDTPDVYEVDVHMPSFTFSGEGETTIDFNW